MLRSQSIECGGDFVIALVGNDDRGEDVDVIDLPKANVSRLVDKHTDLSGRFLADVVSATGRQLSAAAWLLLLRALPQ